jgi:hypothetical protein
VSELAERLRCGERVARAVAREVGYVRVARRMLVRLDWLEEWERGRRRQALEPASEAPRMRRRRASPPVDYASFPEGLWRREDAQDAE